MTNKKQFTAVPDGLLVRAPAKINLTLLIAGKRPDGFHDIETIMAKVNFFDEIIIQPGQKAGIELICTGSCWAPPAEENIVYRACKLLLNNCHSQANIKLTLTKNVPAGAGLGSASSDAAAALMGVDRFLNLDLDRAVLSKMAVELGSDVPFFLGGPLAFCKGKGEKIERLGENFDFQALLVLPDVNVSTKKVYANYEHEPLLYEKLNARISALLEKNRIDLASKMCANMLQTSSFHLYKGLAQLKAKVESLGIRPLCLSGSGSAMFCIIEAEDEQKAREYQCKLEEKDGCKSVIVNNNRW